MEGYLEKQAEWLNTWRLRYVRVLAGGTLVYFTTPKDQVPRGLVRLEGATVGLTLANHKAASAKASAAAARDEGDGFSFCLNADGTFMKLRTKSEGQRRAWMAALVLWSKAKDHPGETSSGGSASTSDASTISSNGRMSQPS